jgi:hypothetical protein
VQKSKYTSEGCHNKTRDDMCILGGLQFMWSIFPSFQFRVSVAASQKKPDFGTSKMEKALFMGRKKIGLRSIPHHPKGHARAQYGLILTNYAIVMAESRTFHLKVVQPQRW